MNSNAGSEVQRNSPENRAFRLCANGRTSGAILGIVGFATLFARSAQTGTLLDPRPENSSTLFGYAVAVVGDIDNDGVPDLAVGAPFQDGDFLGAQGFGAPQNVGKVWLVSGSALRAIRALNDPEFQMMQPLKFGGEFGSSVADAGDINADGVSDVLVGVPHHIQNPKTKDQQINAGRAFVFSGKDSSLLLTLDDPTPQEGARLGAAVAGIGDINADGFPDFAVGAPGKNTPGVDDSQVGTVYIFSGKDGSVIRSLDYPSPGPADAGASFGAAVANAGSVAGPPDVIIGAPRRSRAFVFNSATGQLKFTIPCPVTENKPSFGFAVAAGKDLDGDMIPDLVVGAPLRNALRGEVFVFSGADASLQHTIDSPDPQTFARFGASITLLEDVTGDGKPDIVVGAPDQDVTQGTSRLVDAGQAFVFKGSDGSLFKTLTSTAPQAHAGFGYSLPSPNLNNAGVAGFVIGTPFANANLVNKHNDTQTHLQIGQVETQ